MKTGHCRLEAAICLMKEAGLLRVVNSMSGELHGRRKLYLWKDGVGE